jgi:hypothetical protein
VSDLVVEERVHQSGLVYWVRVRPPKGAARTPDRTKARSAPTRAAAIPKAPPASK